MSSQVSTSRKGRDRGAKVRKGRSEAGGSPGGLDTPIWLRWIRRIAVAVFLGLIAFSVVQPQLAGRVLWTVAIAVLPLVIVLIGYHRWRMICPLATIAQLPTRWGRSGQRRAGTWLQNNYYYVVFSIFLFCLWLRLVATNGDGYAIAIFLGAASVASVLVGAVFTGRSWCHYVCPVSFVEKLYTEPRGLQETENSQCPKCTACKRTCPDINEENGYWKEALTDPKRLVYFSFPGVVLAFYVYYFLQAGTWDYYFGGRWTGEVGLYRTAFLPGHDAATAGLYFWPQVPRAIAAAGTLLVGGFTSWTLFSVLERWLGPIVQRRSATDDESRSRHIFLSVSAFTAFVCFYSFAGAPTLRLVPGLPHFFLIAVVITATLFMVRRFNRSQEMFAEETLAKKIIARWQWTDREPPKDLREAFLIHTIRSESRAEAQAEMLGLYKDAVREVVESGVVERTELERLESLRSKLHISAADHERVMADLDEEQRALISDTSRQISPEKRLQLDTYSQALAVIFERAQKNGGVLDDSAIQRLQQDFGVTADEHTAVFERLMSSREGIAEHMFEAPGTIERAVETMRQLSSHDGAPATYLSRLLRRRWQRAAEGLYQSLGASVGEESRRDEGLFSLDTEQRREALVRLSGRLADSSAERLLAAHERVRVEQEGRSLADSLRGHLQSPDPYVRAVTLYTLSALGLAMEGDWRVLLEDGHPLVSETAAALSGNSHEAIERKATTVEKMVALGSIGIFDSLQPEEISRLAESGQECRFEAGSTLCREGDHGEEVFVLLDGEVKIYRFDGNEERLLGIERSGGCIGELAVMDPAPRAATVIAGESGARALSLDGQAFKNALDVSPAVSYGIIRTLAQRLRNVTIGN